MDASGSRLQHNGQGGKLSMMVLKVPKKLPLGSPSVLLPIFP